MPRYKKSPEERAAEKDRKENLQRIMQGLGVKNFDDLKDDALREWQSRPLEEIYAVVCSVLLRPFAI